MKTKLAMCSLEIDDTTMEVCISDVQKIDHVPALVNRFCRGFVKDKKINDSGLPSVLYLGTDRIRVVGAFTYGVVSYIEFEGNWKDIMKQDSFIVIDAFKHEDKDSEETA